MSSSPRILTFDIETSPNISFTWGLWQQNVSLSQLVKSGEVISFAAKWYGEKKIYFHSVHHDGKEAMLGAAYDYLNEADIVVHYNGKTFDVPWFNAEFVRQGWSPPSPYAQVDLLQTVRSNFRFPSKKLDYVSQELGLGAKTSHTGFQLWVDCMEGKEKAWNLMRKYNRQDVALTEKLYDRLKPWIKNHPHAGLFSGEDHGCVQCGGMRLAKRGTARTASSVYQRYQCSDCGRWQRGNKALSRTIMKGG